MVAGSKGNNDRGPSRRLFDTEWGAFNKTLEFEGVWSLMATTAVEQPRWIVLMDALLSKVEEERERPMTSGVPDGTERGK